MTYTPTRRPTVMALDEALGHTFPILDHGFVRVIDYMGDDSAIVQAARVSYGQGTKTTSEDQGLINYLMRHRHTTPFEMCEIKFHMKMPIFVARQFIRHRTASVNEVSARYSILDKEFYIPAEDQIAGQSKVNKQGRDEAMGPEKAAMLRQLLITGSDAAYGAYEESLEENLARELARMHLTLNTYTSWYWKCDLHNLFHFLGLRADSHAQHEIRVYAEKMLELVQLWVPMATAAFVEYRQKAVTLSARQFKAVGAMVYRKQPHGEILAWFLADGGTQREWSELCNGFDFEPVG